MLSYCCLAMQRPPGDLALTKRFYGYDSRLVLGPSTLKSVVIPSSMEICMKYVAYVT